MKLFFNNGNNVDFFSKKIFGKIMKLSLFFVIPLLSACVKGGSYGDQNSPIDSLRTALFCPTCSVFEIAYNAGESLCIALFKQGVPFAQTFLWLAFAIWLAFHVMKFVSSFKEPDVAGFWNAIASRMFCVIIASLALLPNLHNIVDIIFNSFLEIVVNIALQVVGTLRLLNSSPISCSEATPKDNLICLLTDTSQIFIMGFIGVFPAFLLFNPITMPFGFLLTCLSIFTSMVMVIVLPLYLLESVIVYFIVLALLPLWVVAWAFPITRNFAVQAWEKLAPIYFQILSLCVFLALSAQIYRQVIYEFLVLNDLKKLNPLRVLSTPGVLLFISLFIYFFGGVLLDTINVIFNISGTKPSAVKAMGKAVADTAKNLESIAEDRVMGEMDDKKDGYQKGEKGTGKALERNQEQLKEAQAKQKALQGENGDQQGGEGQNSGDNNGQKTNGNGQNKNGNNSSDPQKNNTENADKKNEQESEANSTAEAAATAEAEQQAGSADGE